jgi:hypothetical protein
LLGWNVAGVPGLELEVFEELDFELPHPAASTATAATAAGTAKRR